MRSNLRNTFLSATAVIALSLTAANGQGAVEAEIVSLPDWHPELLYEGGFSAEEFIGDMEVVGPTGDDIGNVENIIIGDDGRVLSIIAEVGGLLEMGDTHINVPWDQVEIIAADDEVRIPVTQETVEDYSLFPDALITAPEAATQIEEVEGDNAGVALTGPRAWRATELIDDYARLRDGDGFVNYGYVDDIIIKDGAVAAVVVSPDVGFGARGLYAYPYYGYGYGWNPGLDYYELPYDRDEIADIEPFEAERFEIDD